MQEDKDDSFRNLNRKEKLVAVAGITLLISMVLGFVFGLYFFGMAGVFKVLGVQYESVWSLLIFVVSFFIVGIIVELFTKVIFKLSVRNIMGKTKVYIIRFIIVSTSNWLVLFTVDEFMSSITLSMNAEIIIALLLTVLEIAFDDKKD